MIWCNYDKIKWFTLVSFSLIPGRRNKQARWDIQEGDNRTTKKFPVQKQKNDHVRDQKEGAWNALEENEKMHIEWFVTGNMQDILCYVVQCRNDFGSYNEPLKRTVFNRKGEENSIAVNHSSMQNNVTFLCSYTKSIIPSGRMKYALLCGSVG